MTYEIQELTTPKPNGEMYRIADPDIFGRHQFDVVYSNYFTREAAEADLVILNRSEEIDAAFDEWIHDKAHEYGVHRSEIAKELDVQQFMR